MFLIYLKTRQHSKYFANDTVQRTNSNWIFLMLIIENSFLLVGGGDPVSKRDHGGLPGWCPSPTGGNLKPFHPLKII